MLQWLALKIHKISFKLNHIISILHTKFDLNRMKRFQNVVATEIDKTDLQTNKQTFTPSLHLFYKERVMPVSKRVENLCSLLLWCLLLLVPLSDCLLRCLFCRLSLVGQKSGRALERTGPRVHLLALLVACVFVSHSTGYWGGRSCFFAFNAIN